MIIVIIALLTIPIAGICQAPSGTYSELFNALKTARQDTAKIAALADLSWHFYFKPNQTNADRDSCVFYANRVIQTARQSKNIVGEAIGFRLLGNYSRSVGLLTDAKRYLTQAIDLFEREKDYLNLGETYFDYASTYRQDNEIMDKIKIAEKSMDAFQKSGSIRKQADIHKELADLYMDVDDTKAFFLAKKALRLYTSIHYPYLQGIYDILGNTTYSLGDLDGALNYSILALNTAIKVGDTTLQLATIHNRIGMKFFSMKKYHQAIEHFSEGLKIAQKYDDPMARVYIKCNLASAFIKINKADKALVLLAELDKLYPTPEDEMRSSILPRYVLAFSKLRQFDRGKKYCDELITLLQKVTDTEIQALGGSALVQFFTDSKQFDRARHYLAMMDTIRAGVPINIRILNQMRWFKLDSTTGNWLSAIRHYQIASALDDSIFSQVKSSHIEFLEMQLAVEKSESQIVQKQHDIEILTEQNKIQESNLAQHALTTKVFAGCIVLTLAVAFLLVLNIRHRQKTHRQLQEKQRVIDQTNTELNALVQEKEWLVNEIHHRVNANFQSVISLLDTQKQHMQNEKAMEAMEDSIHRIQTMALVHQRLFASDSYDTIRFDDYITNLIAYIRESLETDRILQFILNITPIELHFSYGQPLGMIISEAVTNAIKYAFPTAQKGVVAISLTEDTNGYILLTIQDNGIGFPENTAFEKTSSMGMNLIRGLCQEIDGRLQTFNNPGATIQISFTYDRPRALDSVAADADIL